MTPRRPAPRSPGTGTDAPDRVNNDALSTAKVGGFGGFSPTFGHGVPIKVGETQTGWLLSENSRDARITEALSELVHRSDQGSPCICIKNSQYLLSGDASQLALFGHALGLSPAFSRRCPRAFSDEKQTVVFISTDVLTVSSTNFWSHGDYFPGL